MELVSVILPVYNGADYLVKCLESLVNQSYSNIEIVIVDDGSFDSSSEIINHYKDKRIKYIKNIQNIGLPKSLNIGIKASRGNFIARQDVDDISHTKRLETLLDYLIKNNYDIVGSSYYNIDVWGNIMNLEKLNTPNDIKSHILDRNLLFPHGSVLCKKEIFEKYGYYNEYFTYSQDAEYWLRLNHLGAKIGVHNEALYFLRRTPVKNKKKYFGQYLYLQLLREQYNYGEKLLKFHDFIADLNNINTWLLKYSAPNDKMYFTEYIIYCIQKSLSNKRIFIKYYLHFNKSDIILFFFFKILEKLKGLFFRSDKSSFTFLLREKPLSGLFDENCLSNK